MNQPTVCIETQHADLLNRVVSEMVDKNYPLKSIDSYVFQIENFLNIMTSSNMETTDIKSYLNNIKSDTSLQALHFFFREILPTVPSEKWCYNQTL